MGKKEIQTVTDSHNCRVEQNAHPQTLVASFDGERKHLKPLHPSATLHPHAVSAEVEC